MMIERTNLKRNKDKSNMFKMEIGGLETKQWGRRCRQEQRDIAEGDADIGQCADTGGKEAGRDRKPPRKDKASFQRQRIS